jgi:hypothetical protein
MRLSDLQESQTVVEDANPVQKAAVHFFNSKVGDVDKEAVDNYVDAANSLYKKAQQQGFGDQVKQALVKAKKSPYLQGGVVTTIGAVLTGGLLASAQRFGLTPGQTNMLLQAVLNTVIPTVVSRINGRSWDETIKYTLASAATGIGAAAAMGESDYSPMTKDAMKADKIRSLENLIAKYKEQGRQLKVQELELELKKLQGVAEGPLNESDKFTSWYDWKDQAISSGYTITKKDDKIVALNKQGQIVGHWSDVGRFLSGKAPRPNFNAAMRAKKNLDNEQGVAEEINPEVKQPGFKHRIVIGDYIYSAKGSPSGLRIECHDSEGTLLGYAQFMFYRDHLESQYTKVRSQYQGQGIASNMYAYAHMLGNDIQPSPYLEPDGKKMWRAFKKSGAAKIMAGDTVKEAKMSAAVRFQRAMDRERAKTDAHYRAGKEVMARARAEQDKKKEQEKK